MMHNDMRVASDYVMVRKWYIMGLMAIIASKRKVSNYFSVGASKFCFVYLRSFLNAKFIKSLVALLFARLKLVEQWPVPLRKRLLQRRAENIRDTKLWPVTSGFVS